jgi:O-antigen/teichoic acid export membrane protein
MARRFSVITIGKIAGAVIQALTFGLLGRTLGPTEFGVFSLAYGIVLLCMTFAELGLGSRALRVAAEPDPGEVLSTVLLLRAATSLTITIVLGVVISAVGLMTPFAAWMLMVYATGDLFGNLAQSFLIGFFSETRAMAVLLVRRLLVAGLLVGGLLLAPGSGLVVCYFALGVGGLTGYVSGLIALRSRFGRLGNPIRFISHNRRFWSSSVALNVQQADTILLSAIAGPTLTGLYSAAVRLSSPMNLLTSSVLQSVVPHLTAKTNHADRRKAFNRVFKAMLVYAGGLSLSSALAPIAVLVLFGSAYTEAWPMAVAVVLVAAANSVLQTFMAWYYSIGVPRLVPFILWGWAILMLSSVAIGASFDSLIVIGVGQVLSAWVVVSALGLHYRFSRERGGVA